MEDVGIEGRVRSSPGGCQRPLGKGEKAKTFSGCAKEVAINRMCEVEL